MGNLNDAIDASENRKAALFGEPDNAVISFTSGEEQDRAMFSGFDIDYDELVTVVNNISGFYLRLTPGMGLIPLFQSAWIEGLLVGLLVKKD